MRRVPFRPASHAPFAPCARCAPPAPRPRPRSSDPAARPGPAATLVAAILATLLAGPAAVAQTAPAGATEGSAEPPLRVAVKDAPPFVLEAPGGELSGISIELWERVADRLGRETEIVRIDEVPEMLAAVEAGEVDAAIAAISITPEREVRLDMSHGYHLAGIGIAVSEDAMRSGFLTGIRNLISPQFLAATGALAVLLVGVGIVVWLAERRGNAEQFPRDPVRGIGNGFWFSAVTMTTVGYGDRTPLTLPGRLVALVWMFASIIVISAFTGSIASSLTAARVEGAVRGLNDLPSVRVGAVTGTSGATALADRGVVAVGFPDVDAGMSALAAGDLDAFVHDHPILVHAARSRHAGAVAVLSLQFDLTSYAVAMPGGSELLEPVNVAILEVTRDAAWTAVIRRYLGDRD